MRSLLIPFLLFMVIFAENIDLNFDTDKRDWVDLLDPLSPEFNSNNLGAVQRCESHDNVYQKEIERLITANELLKNKRSDSIDVLLKHILRQFLLKLDVKLLDGHTVQKFARVYLSSSDVATLMEYLKSEKSAEEVALREKVRVALENFIETEEYQEESGLIPTIQRWMPYLFALNVIFLPFAILKVLRGILGPRQLGVFVLIALLCISYYFTYIRKYQEVLADRFQRIHDPTDACSPKGLIAEAFGVILSYVKIKGKDQCLQKYEDMLIEPFLLVDPLQVFGEVVTNFLLSPFSVLGIHLNKFFNDFFVDTPVYLMLIKLIFLLLGLFYLSGYRIRTIFATLEPTARPAPVAQRVEYHQMPDRPQITEQTYRPPVPPHRVQCRPLKNEPKHRQELVEDQTDSFDVSSIANLDDSNVTRRRKMKTSRSHSLPRFYHNLSLR